MAINIPMDDELRDKAKERASQMVTITGSSSLAAYIRYLIIKDLKNAERNR